MSEQGRKRPRRRPPPESPGRDGVEVALERAVTGALRSTIHDHGAITPEVIGSATKRVMGNLRNARPATAAAAAALGRLGGQAGRGKSKRRSAEHYAAIAAKGGAAARGPKKRRPAEHYSKASSSRWASMTPEERSAEMSRRRQKGAQKKKGGPLDGTSSEDERSD